MTTGTSQVVVTGLGAMTPFGVGVPLFWNALLEGRSAVRKTEQTEWRKWIPVSAQLPDINLEDYLSKKQLKNTDRFTQLGLIAASEAVHDAKLAGLGNGAPETDACPDRMGVSVGTAYGGVRSLTEGAATLAENMEKRMSPRLLSKSLSNATGAALAKKYNARGPVMTYTTACAASANAIGEAMHWIRRDEADLVLAGGTESLFTPAVLSGLHSAGAIATEGPVDMHTWSRPFDANRKGMAVGEGAAFLILESEESARKRGAPVYARLTGYGASNDAYHETAPRPDGEGAVLAMNKALEAAGLHPADIGYVNAHATATPLGDKAESVALEKMFGNYYANIPISSIKGVIGHMMGSAAAIESVAAIKTVETGWLPPTRHCTDPDQDAPPNLLREPVQQDVSHVLSNSFGFGGQNGALIWSKA